MGSPGSVIPIEKLLQQYGKTHLQLVNAEENLGQARAIAASLEAQLKAALKKAVEQDEKIKRYAALHGELPEESQTEIPAAGKVEPGLTLVKDIKLPAQRPETNLDPSAKEAHSSSADG